MSTIDIHEAIKAIRDTVVPIIDPDDDYLTIVAAEERFAEADARKKKELDEAHANLKALAKILDAARVSSTRPQSVASAKMHLATLNDLDAARLSLAKSISDAEGGLASREDELTALKEKKERLENLDPATEHEEEMDGSALRLEIFRGLGFIPILDKNGNKSKFIIRTQSGDVQAMNLEQNSASHFELTQYLWKTAST